MLKTMVYIIIVAVIAILLGEGDKTKTFAQWGYKDNLAPSNWSSLDEEYRICKDGKTQSPINIEDSVDTTLEELTFYDDSRATTFEYDSKVLKVSFARGNAVEFMNNEYALQQMVFHTPAENKIEGEAFPMEVQLIHTSKKGSILILSVLVEEDEETNIVLNKLLRNIPLKAGDKNELKSDIYGYDILPEEKIYFTFDGSLTTPPCTEGVKWVVLKNTIKASKDQIKDFQELMGNNARPIQNKNARFILE